MQDSISVALRQSRLFSDLSLHEFEHLASQVYPQHYKEGDIILTEGEIGDCLYLIVSGSVRIYTLNEEKKKSFWLA